MAVTEIILKENIPGLGAEADIVRVRKGYARNHLVPSGKAYEVTPANLKRISMLKARRAEREQRELQQAQEFAERINKLRLEFLLETGESGKAFGSVTAKDIEQKLATDHNVTVDRHRIELDRPIKETGLQEVAIKLHGEVTARLKVEIISNRPKVEEAAAEAETKAKPRRKVRTSAA